MDAFAVSICDGMIYRQLNKRKAVFMPLTFGLFQAVMPLIGFYVGMAFQLIDEFDAVEHWIYFSLLVFMGVNII